MAPVNGLIGSASKRSHSQMGYDPSAQVGEAPIAPSDPKKMKIELLSLTAIVPVETWFKIIRLLPVNDLMRFAQVSIDAKHFAYTILKEPSQFARIILEVKPNVIKFACSSLLRQANPSKEQLIDMVRQCPELIELRQGVVSSAVLFKPLASFTNTSINVHALLLNHFFRLRQEIMMIDSITPEKLDFLLSKLPHLEDQLGVDFGVKPQPGYVLSNISHYIQSASNKTFSLLIHFLMKRYLNPIEQLWKYVIKNASPDRQQMLFDTLVNDPTITLEKSNFTDDESNSWVVIRLDQIFYGSKGPISGQGVLKDSDGNDFKGQFIDGKPFEGEGCLGKPNNFDYLKGSIKQGRPFDAEVRYKDPSGNIFFGSYKEGIPFEGSGNVQDQLGRILDFGRLTEGRPHRLQRVVFPNKDVCIGPFEEGKCKGRGKYYFADSSKYDGSLEDFRPHGKGRRVYPNGNTYEGEFNNGAFHGKGLLQGPKGSIEGDFRDGKPNGRCVYKYSNGFSYEGEVKNGEIHGKGVFKTLRATYEGDFIGGKRNGCGVVTHFDGLRHSGAFIEDKPDSVHQVTTPEGESYTIEYRAGKPWNGKFRIHRPDGSYLLKSYIDGQEAPITPL